MGIVVLEFQKNECSQCHEQMSTQIMCNWLELSVIGI